jgi:hypothetical protein
MGHVITILLLASFEELRVVFHDQEAVVFSSFVGVKLFGWSLCFRNLPIV